ncbi:PKD domain-containing protein [Cytophagaceae bacterium ABcell3]|nr:PKD domain-containing protein [Cytophagaceae bacterium ABcell3]
MEIKVLGKKRKAVIVWLLSMLFISVDALAQRDLPNPGSNVQEIPAGSFVVPMCTTYQSIVPADAPPFNLKSYGLIYNLLQSGVRVKWAIRTPKERDDVDFSAVAERFFPDYVAANMMDFRGGPFIVPDTILPCGTSSLDIINNFGNDVAVYKLVENTNVDVGYTLTHRPKIAVFNNGNNEQIHTKILNGAGIHDYDIMDAADIRELMNCYTFASEPHADLNQVSQEVVDGVREFLMNGGNFLAQCAAVGTYENQGLFHTTNGIETVNTEVSHLYPNADLAYSQMHGPMEENEGGSIDNWTLAEGSAWQPHAYRSVSHIIDDTVVAMGAKLTDPGVPGGNVYYLGGHDYGRTGSPRNPDLELTTLLRLNALRLYLNAAVVASGNPNMAWADAGGPVAEIGCSDSVMLGCEPVGPPQATYLWTPAEGLSCTTCPNPMASPSETTTYTVHVTHGCTVTDTIQVKVESTPVAEFTNDTVCEGLPTTFVDETTGGEGYWLWDFGDTASGDDNTSNLQNPEHIFSSAGTFEVTLIAGSSESCADTIVQEVIVNPSPVVSVNSPLVCEGDSTELVAEGATSYSWSTGDTTETIYINPLENDFITVTGSAEGCTSVDTAWVTVSPVLSLTTEVVDVSCYGDSSGAASVEVSGGIEPFTYSWSTDPEQDTELVENLFAGTYSVIVTDSIGCVDSASVDILEPEVLEVEGETEDVSCYGGADGSASVLVSGGTQPYSYSWDTSPVQRTSEAIDLMAGEYTVVVTDSLGCSDSLTVIIDQPDGLELEVEASDVYCYGDSTGTAAVTVAGGTAPYGFRWSTIPEQTSEEATGLSAGDYSVFVTDSTGCEDTIMVTISQPDSLELVVDKIDVSCYGGTDGSAAVEVAGGTAPYSYSWDTSPEQTSADITDLAEGIYNVLVTDSLGCQDTIGVQIYQPDSIALSIETLNVNCYDGNDGSATVHASGGTAPYSYLWDSSPEQNTAHAEDLVAGVYLVTVTDSLGCTDTASAIISQPEALVSEAVFTDVTCYGGDDGQASASTTGGIEPYTYSWDTDPVQDDSDATGLTAGDYVLTVTDSVGCTDSLVVTITQPERLVLSAEATDALCYGDSSGTASVSVTGGVAPYEYSWNTSPAQISEDAMDLPAGVYTVTVTDSSGCQDTVSANVGQPDLIVLNTESTGVSCLDGDDGSASVSVTGGTAPFTYNWNTSPVQTTSTASELGVGEYIVTVLDANQCEMSDTVMLGSPDMPVADFSSGTACLGDGPVSFTDLSVEPPGSEITEWEWSFGDPSSGNLNHSDVQNPDHEYGSEGIFEVTLTVITDKGCSDYIAKPVEVFPLPRAHFGSPSEGCAPLCVDFIDSSTVLSGTIESWEWDLGDASAPEEALSTEQNPSHCFTEVGSYDVSLRVVTDNGCLAELKVNEFVKVHPDPAAPVLDNERICTDTEDYQDIGVDEVEGYSYFWEQTFDSSAVITVSEPGDYLLRITNQWGCSSEGTANVRDVCPPRLFVGNAFSPDGDGINDLFTVHSAFIGDYQMLIFNRWGEIIFESRDVNEFWDGNYRGEPMPVGVYPWIIIYEGIAEEYRGPYKKEGSVTIIR